MARAEPSLLARALAHLARREHSRLQLRRKLVPHAQSAAEVEQLLDRLSSDGLLSDARFAEAVIRRRGERLGAARVANELRAQGLDKGLIATATAQLSRTELVRARAVWSRRFGRPPADAAERGRQTRFLLQRGFAADIVRRVIGGDAGDD